MKSHKYEILALITGGLLLIVFGSVLVGLLVYSMNSTPPKKDNEPQPVIENIETSKEWRKVISLSGSSEKRSKVFKLSGAEARMRYKLDGNNYSFLAIYIVNEGESLAETGGFTEVSVDGDTEDSTRIVKPAGEYYLDVISGNGNWEVTIEEYK